MVIEDFSLSEDRYVTYGDERYRNLMATIWAHDLDFSTVSGRAHKPE